MKTKTTNKDNQELKDSLSEVKNGINVLSLFDGY